MESYALIFSLVLLTHLVDMRQLPSFVQKCKYTNTEEISSCIKQRIEDLKPRLANGIPELKMPPLDPLFIPKIEVDTGDGIKVSFKNITITGMLNMKIIDYTYDIERKNHTVHFLIPFFHAESLCDMNVKLPLLNMEISGSGGANVTDIEVKGIRDFSLVKKNGKTYLKLGNIEKKEIKYGKSKVYFEKLFGDNADLTERINQLLNENMSELSKNVDPLIYQSIFSMIGKVLQNFWDEYPLEEAFDSYSNKN